MGVKQEKKVAQKYLMNKAFSQSRVSPVMALFDERSLTGSQ